MKKEYEYDYENGDYPEDWNWWDKLLWCRWPTKILSKILMGATILAIVTFVVLITLIFKLLIGD